MTPFILSADRPSEHWHWKSLKITNELQTANRRRIDNTTVKRKKETRINNDLYITTEKNKDRATRTTGVNLGGPEG
jgi:hypothetical protein